MSDRTPLRHINSSKFLTPCRTFGLKRKPAPKQSSDRSSNEVPRKIAKVSPIVTTPSRVVTTTPLPCDVSSPRPVSTVKSLIQDVKIYKKTVSEKKNIAVKTPCLVLKKLSVREIERVGPSTEDISVIVGRINDKVDQLANSQQNVCSKKHNILDLEQLTDKWTSACRQIIPILHSEMKTAGRPCSVEQILKEHQVPESLFSPDDFDLE